jgi:CO/xanthine dehydrogenase FAD-binding subunit
VARRLTALEHALIGVPLHRLGQQVRSEHLAVLAPIDDMRATALYRSDAASTLVRRALDACVDA